MIVRVINKNKNHGYDLYENSTFIKRYYSINKVIDIATQKGQNLFGIKHYEVVDSRTGEIVYSIN